MKHLCQTCGAPAHYTRSFRRDKNGWRKNYAKNCAEHLGTPSAAAAEASRARLARVVEAQIDWASDPCKRCGKWPLSILNKSGYCRRCHRNHIGGKNRAKQYRVDRKAA